MSIPAFSRVRGAVVTLCLQARTCMTMSKPYGFRLSLSFSLAFVCPVTLPTLYDDHFCYKWHFVYIVWCKHECCNSCVHNGLAILIMNIGCKHHHGNIPSSCTIGIIEGGTRSFASVAWTCACMLMCFLRSHGSNCTGPSASSRRHARVSKLTCYLACPCKIHVTL